MRSDRSLLTEALRLLLNRIRLIGAIIPVVLFGSSLLSHGAKPIVAIVIPVVWFLGLLLGGKYQLFASMWHTEASLPRRPAMAWAGAFWGGLFTVTTAALLIPRSTNPGVLRILPPWFALIYATSKLGCWRFNCCDWKLEKAQLGRLDLIPLPLLEAALSTISVVYLLSTRAPCGTHATALLFASHGAIRCLSAYGQGRVRSVTALLRRPDSGLILVVGVGLLLYECWWGIGPSLPDAAF